MEHHPDFKIKCKVVIIFKILIKIQNKVLKQMNNKIKQKIKKVNLEQIQTKYRVIKIQIKVIQKI